jgi:regulator of replication initiation timing
VKQRPDGYYELNVDPIHWAVINAIKELGQKIVALFRNDDEQSHKIAKLEKENLELKAKNNEVEKRLEKLERSRAPASSE